MVRTGETSISAQTQELLSRPTIGQVRFSDVYREVAELSDPTWWRVADFDAELTDGVESTGRFPDDEQIPIGLRPWLTPYGLLLADDLLRARDERLKPYEGVDPNRLHPDLKRELTLRNGATIALANYAPRDDENTAQGANGSDFFLAITDSGLEVYVTPLSFLSGLEARNRIAALYQIPTKGHPEFNGDHEQFRSARVVRTRRHPDHLVTIFEYHDSREVSEAKQNGFHPDVIPLDNRDGHIAYVDKFGNTKLELQNARQIRGLKLGQTAMLRVKSEAQETSFEVAAAEDLRSAPLGKLAIYANCSDHQDAEVDRGLVELIVRVNGNPSTSRGTAIFQLLERVPDLDIATAEVSLHA